ncbi:homospermidine synthase [Kordiimonas sp.]|uniref:homospermidine synthase n=1 Tax=Kordiimonas sp. TaxID=1970157 RepID=UPI003A9476EB
MTDWPIYAPIKGALVIVGFGSIGQGVLPLILRHFDIEPTRITIISADESGRSVAEEYGVCFVHQAITPDNLEQILSPLFTREGGFLVNLSVDVSSLALVRFCRTVGAFYLDTCIEPWSGGYTDPDKEMSHRTNYWLREKSLRLAEELGAGPTAVMAHGANPGLVSHFVKQALVNIAKDTGVDVDTPRTRTEWAALASKLNVQGIHIAERDTQVSDIPKVPGEFVNTWSIDGFLSEGMQPAELGWGTFEDTLPEDGGEHEEGCGAAIYLKRPGANTRVRTWTPLAGPILGYLITHNEAISIADYFTAREEDGTVAYRPTCHYAYHPCDDAVLSLHEFVGGGFVPQANFRLMGDEITKGLDELGVLLYGHAKNAYWFGSQLDIHETRELVPYQNATGLQVSAAVLAGMVWALENPNEGMVEAEAMNHERILDVAAPYLGPVVGSYTDWTPVTGRTDDLFPADYDTSEPWLFKNVICR